MAQVDYTVIYEKAGSGISAYVPDLPGCVAAGSTRKEVERLIHAAIELHLDEMRDAGLPVPVPTTRADTVRVAG